jgi:ATP-dependent Clp protease adaptor protein ClpS
MSAPTSQPTRCKILLLNDDYTPMEFVVGILQDVFGLTPEQAVSAMLSTHRQGRFAVATMEKSVAEETVRSIHDRARQAGHPFQCVLEAEAAG